MAGLEDLLRYKQKVELKNPRTNKTVKTVWIRILGDEDLRDAFKFSRIMSSEKRAKLRDKDSDTYKDEIRTLMDSTRAEKMELIVASKENQYANEAPIIVVREELPKIEEIAVQPDAPTLEEQERFDAAEEEDNNKYLKAIEDYIQTKVNELKASLEELTDDRLNEIAEAEFINIQSLQAFLEELNQQKAYRATYMDEACTKRGFDSIDKFKNADSNIKSQLIVAYSELEVNPDEVKN